MITADDIMHDLESLTYRKVLASHPERTALACTRALFDCLFLNFRGQAMYVPTRDLAEQHEKYLTIWQEFNGKNHSELAIRHRLSLQQIYNIVHTMRSGHVRKHQNDLFPHDLPNDDNRPLTLVVLADYLPVDLHRAGIAEAEAKTLVGEIAAHLCRTYPGIAVRITEAMRLKRQNGSGSLFDDDWPEAS
jgi:Mor family transcriptional regulator